MRLSWSRPAPEPRPVDIEKRLDALARYIQGGEKQNRAISIMHDVPISQMGRVVLMLADALHEVNKEKP